ncbi:MAG: endopeptidase La [Oscillospiraceae bacterium]|nr:endopeptidase La [Oscillospiraceae bacterium]
MTNIPSSERMPVLALRGLTVFPGMTMHFDVGRDKSVHAVERAMSGNQRIFLVTQRDIRKDNPQEADFYPLGTICQVKQLLKLPSESIRVLVEGESRGRIMALHQEEPTFYGRVETVENVEYDAQRPRVAALLRQAQQLFSEFLELSEKPHPEQMLALAASEDPGYAADFMAQNATFSYQEKQKVLEQLHPVRRLELCNRLMSRELDVLRLESELSDKVQEGMTRNQRDYFLREQMKVIRDELGDEDEDSEAAEYLMKIKKLAMPEETAEKLRKEVARLMKQPGGSSEAAVIRNYLDAVTELPWNTRTRERVDLAAARKILDEDHYGLEKVKERVLEFLAVRKLAPDLRGQVLCLVGPPGVGKTSIAMSIARSLNRKLARISLGGVHDEAEIRGHRKTYIGAMPGRIIAAVQQAGSKNALILLDEVDKMGADYRGDPSSALLEVLDIEQNNTFRDHYLEVPFDLSECVFITTANTTETIPSPLLDRMDVIELGSYTDEEKLRIAADHLLPKQMKKHGIPKRQLRVSDDAIRETIACYTRESGVRNLERELATVCRRTAMRLVGADAPKRVMVTGKNLEEFLGVRKYLPDEKPQNDQIGLVTGLAWTSVGGETLEVEVNVVEGVGKLELTGNLGDVMKESVHAAMSCIRARAELLKIPADFYKTKDIHVHFPEGAVPKDGPSAGIAVCTALVSALTGMPVRHDVAMTGEISIRGRVLPIGGLKEKTMAALRHGIRTVILPAENQKDLEEIDQTVRRALNFIPVSRIEQVLETALDYSAFSQAEEPGAEQPLPVPPVKSERKPGLRQ